MKGFPTVLDTTAYIRYISVYPWLYANSISTDVVQIMVFFNKLGYDTPSTVVKKTGKSVDGESLTKI